jgi:hypothetical protein
MGPLTRRFPMRTVVPAILLLAASCFVTGCESGTKITGVDPNFGNVAGNDDVVVEGSGFKEGMVVQFGKNQTKHVVIDSPSRLRVKTPSGVEGKTDVVIIRDDGKTFVLKDGFTYTRDAPTGK